MGERVIFSIKAEDPKNDLMEIRFYSNNIGLGSDVNWPYLLDWETTSLEQGDYTIKAEALYSSGLRSTVEIAVSISNLSSPNNLSAVPMINGDIQLNWTDNTSFESGFKIERDAGPGYAEVGAVSADVTDYTDTGLVYGRIYRYRVAATTSNITSDYSNSITVTACQSCVLDIDGNVYNTIEIGDQVWMAENLMVTHYQDGTSISEFGDSLTGGSYDAYSNNVDLADTYGYLYNWYAVTDIRDIAPAGWHVPTDAEWKKLEMALGMSQSNADSEGARGSSEGSKLAGNYNLWEVGPLNNNLQFGASGFNALPGGLNEQRYGYFKYDQVGKNTAFWSSTEHTSGTASVRVLNSSRSGVWRGIGTKESVASIRLVQD